MLGPWDISELCVLVRRYGVGVPVFHNDLSPDRGRQMDVDLPGLDRYPITRFDRDWRDDPSSFDGFVGDEKALDACRRDSPVFYPELQAGWYDGWGGPGYGRIRELLGPEQIDNVTKALTGPYQSGGENRGKPGKFWKRMLAAANSTRPSPSWLPLAHPPVASDR